MSAAVPAGWSRAPLGQLAKQIQYGLTASAKAGANGPRFLRITDIQEGRVDWAAVPSCDAGGDELSKYELRPGDIVFARTGATTGKSYLIRGCPRGAVFASYLIRVRPLETISSEFLGLFFQSPAYWEHIAGSVSGNAQPNCNATKLASLEVPFPPLPEQKRIVEKVEALLAQVTTARERLTRVRETLKRFRQSVLAAACSGRLTEEWRANQGQAPAAEASLSALADADSLSPADEYDDPPQGWRLAPLGKVTANFDGRRIPVKSKDRAGRHGPYPYYGASGIIDSIDEFLFEGDHLLVAEDGANLLSRSTPIAFKASGRFWVNNHAHVVQPVAGIRIRFLETCVNSLDLQAYVTGTAQPKLTQAALNALPIPVPPLDEQREIVGRVDAMLDSLSAVEGRLAAALAICEKMPPSILAKVFRGELVPSVSEPGQIALTHRQATGRE